MKREGVKRERAQGSGGAGELGCGGGKAEGRRQGGLRPAQSSRRGDGGKRGNGEARKRRRGESGSGGRML